MILVQCARAASRTKGTQLLALFGRLRGRRGAKRALVAVAHRVLQIVYILIRRRETYREPESSPEEVAALPARQAQRLSARSEELGVRVRVEAEEAVAPGAGAVAQARLPGLETTDLSRRHSSYRLEVRCPSVGGAAEG